MRISNVFSRYNKGFATFIVLFGCGSSYALDSRIQFSGNIDKIIEVDAERSTGLDALYISNGGFEDLQISYSTQNRDVEWLRFSNLGGGYAETVKDVDFIDNKSILKNVSGDSGYIIKDGERNYIFWIIDYSKNPLIINSVELSPEQDCNSVVLDINGEGDALTYFTINGRKELLSRDIKIEYLSLEWNEENQRYDQIKIEEEREYITDNIILNYPAYCDTDFTISGDRFLEEWNHGISVSSKYYTSNSVGVNTNALQTNYSQDSDKDSNQIKTDIEGLGGSAPVDISFKAFVTDAVVHYEWQMASDEEFENLTYRIYEQDFDYTFTEEGTTYVRFIGSNSDGSCEAYGETYIVTVGSSLLKVPNAFSPGDDGINDIWKVSYRSLIEFECWIFDRQGHELFHYDDPSSGWDGKYKGKYVKPGVYFYVIQAKGSDGVKYKKSGDINILRYKNTTGTGALE